MRTWLIGQTSMNFYHSFNDAVAPWIPETGVDDASSLAEFAGRACYQSWGRPNPKTETNKDYLAHILEIQHESVLEHNTFVFYITGVSRTLTHELIRHRHLSFSELSQRYVDMSESDTITPPALRGMSDWWLNEAIAKAVVRAHDAYDTVLEVLRDKPRKEGREAARAFLPAGMETRLVVSGNARAWRHVISLRNSPGADAEIRQLARTLLVWLKDASPNLFQDMEIEDVTE